MADRADIHGKWLLINTDKGINHSTLPLNAEVIQLLLIINLQELSLLYVPSFVDSVSGGLQRVPCVYPRNDQEAHRSDLPRASINPSYVTPWQSPLWSLECVNKGNSVWTLLDSHLHLGHLADFFIQSDLQ